MEATKQQGGHGRDRDHDLHVQAVWFAAGTAALMACLERAVVVSFVEQWRVLVFLALNLLLLAILFTSTRPNSNSPPQTLNNTPISSTVSEAANEAAIEKESEPEPEPEEDADPDPIDDSKSADNMSKEELNERAEAFIAMFRQHLASDASAFNKTSKTLLSAHIKLSDR